VNELLQNQGRKDGSTHGLPTPGIVVDSYTTKGGMNPSIYCFLLSIIAAVNSTLPLAPIPWAKGIPFFDAIFKARQSMLDHRTWDPVQMCKDLFGHTKETQECISEMMEKTLEKSATTEKSTAYTNSVPLTNTYAREACTACGKEGSTRTDSENFYRVHLRRHERSLNDLLQQSDLSTCVGACKSENIKTTTTVTATGPVFIVFYGRMEYHHDAPNVFHRNNHKAPISPSKNKSKLEERPNMMKFGA
jgi:hypothetical protein